MNPYPKMSMRHCEERSDEAIQCFCGCVSGLLPPDQVRGRNDAEGSWPVGNFGPEQVARNVIDPRTAATPVSRLVP